MFYFILDKLSDVMNSLRRKNFHKSLKASGSLGQLVDQKCRFRTFHVLGS
jgi:hypothetical protein